VARGFAHQQLAAEDRDDRTRRAEELRAGRAGPSGQAGDGCGKHELAHGDG